MENHWLMKADGDTQQARLARIAFAEWLVDHEKGAGQLLARVIVNRLWQHYVGRGIVSTPNDFGTKGQPPTHPELLEIIVRI